MRAPSSGASPAMRRAQQAPGFGREAVDRLRHRRQIGAEREHPIEIVEADDRDVAGNVEPETARGLDRREGGDVGQGEDRRRRVGAMQFEFDRAAQRIEPTAADANPRSRPERGLFERATVAVDARGDVVEPDRMGERRNVAMAELDQMAGRRIGAGEAIGGHGVEARRGFATVDEDGRRQDDALARRAERTVARRHGQQPVDAPRDKRFDAAALGRDVLVRGDEHQIVAAFLRLLLDAVDQCGEENVRDIRHDHADETARGAAQRTCGAVEPVAERGDRFEHRAAAFFAHRAVAVDDIGGGGDRDAGAQSDIANGRRLPRHDFLPPRVQARL